MELSDALAFAAGHHQAVLTTLRSNGRPQLSNVNHHVGEDGVLRVSITAARAKYRNLLREPWACAHITRPDFWSYVVIEGDVSLSPVAAARDDATVEELITLYRAINGEHPGWEDYRAAMVSDGRVVLRLLPTRAYGVLPS
jgi:PPOX class probable F420-dependent enzyme